MKKNSVKTSVFFSLVLALLFLSHPLFSQGEGPITNLSFQNRPIVDIVRVLAETSGATVIFDQSVTGKASFVSPSLPARQALEIFLQQEQLYGEWEGSVVRISRVEVVVNTDSTISLNTENTATEDILLELSRKSPTAIIFDAVPKVQMTIHANDLSLENILTILMRKLPNHVLNKVDSHYYIQVKRNAGNRPSSGRYGGGFIEKEGDLYSLNLEKGRFRDILDELFKLAEIEYSYLGKNDAVLMRLQFKSRTFKELLSLLVEQAGADFLQTNRLYYIYDAKQKDVLARYKSIVYHPLEHINVGTFTTLLPPELSSGGAIKTDVSNNALIIYGTLDKIAEIHNFIKTVDIPRTSRTWKRYDLDYIKPESLKSLLPAELSMIGVTPIANTSSVIIAVSPAQEKKFQAFLEAADRVEQGSVVQLQYIKSEDLLSSLPPNFSKDDIVKTRDPSLIFFKGSDNKLQSFKKILQSIDRPVPQIRYDLLIISTNKSSILNWESSASAVNTTYTEKRTDIREGRGMFLTNLGPASSIDIDTASIFGIKFTLDLSTSITKQETFIFTDTTLNGLSGEKIKFRNTETYRFKNVTQDTEDPSKTIYLGTSEVVSGLFIDINGWVSGNGMITMDVSTTISQQYALEETSDNPPATSERTVDTHVRTMDGTPIVISGLNRNDNSSFNKGLPGLSEIPVLGLPFSNKTKNKSSSELIIYIIPHIDYGETDPVDNNGVFEKVYTKYIKGKVQ